MGGRYIEFEINRDAIARYGLTVGDVQDVLSVALGGMPLTTTVEGLQRYTINLRYDRDFRSDLDSLKRDIVVPTPTGAQIPLGELATIKVVDGPMEIKTEGAVPNDWVYVDIRDIDVGTYVQNAMHAVNAAIAAGQIKLPPGYNIFWSGQYEYMLRAKQRLLMVVPLTLLIITLIIYLNTRSLLKTAIVLLAVPFSLVGAFWTLYLLHYNLSVAVWVGIIALAGLDAETGVIMLLYLDLAYDEWKQKGLMRNLADLRDAIYHGAVKRLRPKIMTACVIIAGLAPILWSHGTGADVMKRIAAPMVGGVITSTISVLVVYPAIYYLWRSRRSQTDQRQRVKIVVWFHTAACHCRKAKENLAQIRGHYIIAAAYGSAYTFWSVCGNCDAGVLRIGGPRPCVCFGICRCVRIGLSLWISSRSVALWTRGSYMVSRAVQQKL